MTTEEKPNQKNTEIITRRLKSILGTWDYVTSQGIIDPERFKLSKPLVTDAVSHYISDLEVLKVRYRIPDRINLFKVAGLMTSALLRYRPIIPIEDEFIEEDDVTVNERYAIHHAMSICSQASPDEAIKLKSQFWFQEWAEDFVHLLHRRNYTPESLSFIFETFSMFVFREQYSQLDQNKIDLANAPFHREASMETSNKLIDAQDK